VLRNYLDRGLSRYMGALSKAQRLSGPGLRAALFQNACTIRAAAEKSFAAAPIGVSLWLEYRKRNPDGLMVPPEDLQDCTCPTSYTSTPAMIATSLGSPNIVRILWHRDCFP
jgi:hypothetical protein